MTPITRLLSAIRRHAKHTRIGIIWCVAGRHQRLYWSNAQCRRTGVMSGIFRPWHCPRCGYQSQQFPVPPERANGYLASPQVITHRHWRNGR